ncbi:MAG TPA: cache domain-containing protein [Candidatus Competibacteraceae bacterium]|nr:MAG: calcium:proton antiporter [Candidatus Competibacteraceae bacterium]HQC72699.1 cache domain-containing protein [Candidatus Competibacteraceae bacterium]
MHKMTLGFALALTLGSAPVLAADTSTASAEEVVAKVHEAAQYLHDKGLAGFADFNNNKDARWVWKDSYVFVYSCRDDAMIAHPLRPDLVGKPILQMKDDKDKALFEELCKAGAKTNGGWVEYWWPKPGEGKASRKISFAHSADVSFKPDIQVAAGIYDDKLTADDLNKIAEKAAAPKKDAP